MEKAKNNWNRKFFAGWLPLYHDMGLVGNILQTIYLGVQCVLMPPVAFLQKPVRWLEAISRFRATTSGGPNFAYELCLQEVTAEQRERLDLSSWDVAFNGAEPIRAETLERFTEVFAPCGFRREAFHPCYGLAEGTLMVTGGGKTEPPVIQTFDAAGLERHEVMSIGKGEKQGRRLAGCGRNLRGQIVRTGAFLREDGGAGTLQQLNVVI